MKRRSIATLLVGSVLASAASGWVASTTINSPAEVAARTEAPTPSPILVPVERRVLASEVVTRGTARFGAPRTLSLTPSALKPLTGVVAHLPRPGDQLGEGDVAMLQSSRPVFLLSGTLPAYRDLGPGLEGEDVRQLQEALVRLGFASSAPTGVYDGDTEAAVSAWYREAGFEPFRASPDQLAAIEARQTELLATRLDILSASDTLAQAGADAAKARAEEDASARSAGGLPADALAARAEADAALAAARADLVARQAALDALLAPALPPSAAAVAQAESDVVLAQTEVQEAAIAAGEADAGATDGLARADEALARAQAALAATVARGRTEADAARQALSATVAGGRADVEVARQALAATVTGGRAEVDAARQVLATSAALGRAEVEVARLALAELEADETATAEALASARAVLVRAEADAAAAAQRDLAALAKAEADSAVAGQRDLAALARAEADAAAASQRDLVATGLAEDAAATVERDLAAAVRDAEVARAAAPGAFGTARARAANATTAAAAKVTAAAAALDALLAEAAPPSRAALTAAEAEVTTARAAAAAASRAGGSQVLQADLAVAQAAAALEGARAAHSAAATINGNAAAALSLREDAQAVADVGLGSARRQAGIQVPADELLIVQEAPIRVAEVRLGPGDPASGQVLVVTNASVAIDGSLPLEEASLVHPGMFVTIDEPSLGIQATGLVARVASTPGTNGLDGFHVYVEVAVAGNPLNLPGASVRLTVPVESSGEEALVVPISAVSLGADGSPRVQVDRSGTLTAVEVVPGLAADGFVAVDVVDGAPRLVEGDLVEIGEETEPSAGS